jgi:Flp pilus assembly protein CpaB
VRRSNRLIILLGVFLAVAGGLMTAVVLTTGSGDGGKSAVASPTPTPEPLTTVVVAKQDINLGDRITADMVGTESLTVSQAAALGGDTFTSVNEVIGKVAGGIITTGQVLLGSRDFLKAGTMVDGQDIAGAIATGMVAVSMQVDQINGVGTLVVPGDRVDIILSVYTEQISLTTTDKAGTAITLTGGSAVTTKMLIQNRKILGTLLPPVENTGGGAVTNPSQGPAATPTQAVVQNNSRQMIVILEVTPADAEVIRWAQRAEKQDPQNYIDLSLALRSTKDSDLPETSTTGITFKMLVDKYGVLPPDPRGNLPPDLAKGVSW